MKCICRETIFIYYVQKVANLATATKANKRQARTGGIFTGDISRLFKKWYMCLCGTTVVGSAEQRMCEETNQVIIQGYKYS